MSPFVIGAFIADWRQWFITGLTGGLMGIGAVLYGFGLVVALVTKTKVAFYLTPVWATLFAYILLYERFGFGRWPLIISGTTRCLLVMRVNPFAFGHDNADFLWLMSGMAWAAGTMVIRRYPNACFMHITFMQYLVGGLLTGGAAFFMGNAIPAFNHVVAALPVAVLESAVVFLLSVLLIFCIMQYRSPELVGILMLSEVLVAAL